MSFVGNLYDRDYDNYLFYAGDNDGDRITIDPKDLFSSDRIEVSISPTGELSIVPPETSDSGFRRITLSKEATDFVFSCLGLQKVDNARAQSNKECMTLQEEQDQKQATEE